MFLIVFFGLISSHAFSAPELKGSPEELKGFLHPTDNVVTIAGEAEESVYTDKAIVSLVITTESKLLSQAISSNSALRERITSTLIDAGIDPDTIKSSKFSSSPEYGWFGSKPSSYKVVNRMAISITQERHLKEIAVVADNHDEVELSDTVFEHTKKDEYNEKVKAKALANVIKTKEFYEESLGLKLTAIGIRDLNIRLRATRGAMVLDEAIVNAAKPEKRSYSSVAKQRDQKNESSFDEIKYEANLSVDFKIE
jgi:uncharacterized protein YggE